LGFAVSGIVKSGLAGLGFAVSAFEFLEQLAQNAPEGATLYGFFSFLTVVSENPVPAQVQSSHWLLSDST
jgi:hypothetical protein